MKHPSSKAAFKVAQRLKNLPIKSMWMDEGFDTRHGCAGCQYFATADKETQKREKEKYIKGKRSSTEGYLSWINSNTATNFKIGAHMMAQDLGFKDKYELQDWAYTNPEIWGNDSGRHMFGGDAEAYGIDNYEMTTQEFYEHWLGVAQRLKKLEEKEKEKEKDKMSETINQITSPTHTQQKELA